MASHTVPTRWVTLVLSCVVVAILGTLAVVLTPGWHDSPAASGAGARADGRFSAFATSPPGPPRTVSVDVPLLPADDFPLVSSAANGQMARYDDILVEVKPDGTLRVLGEQMDMATFRSLLSDQLREQLRTLVTIRPDDNCPFRHVGSVIGVCDEAGVVHRTQPRPGPAAVSVSLNDPA